MAQSLRGKSCYPRSTFFFFPFEQSGHRNRRFGDSNKRCLVRILESSPHPSPRTKRRYMGGRWEHAFGVFRASLSSGTMWIGSKTCVQRRGRILIARIVAAVCNQCRWTRSWRHTYIFATRFTPRHFSLPSWCADHTKLGNRHRGYNRAQGRPTVLWNVQQRDSRDFGLYYTQQYPTSKYGARSSFG